MFCNSNSIIWQYTLYIYISTKCRFSSHRIPNSNEALQLKGLKNIFSQSSLVLSQNAANKLPTLAKKCNNFITINTWQGHKTLEEKIIIEELRC